MKYYHQNCSPELRQLIDEGLSSEPEIKPTHRTEDADVVVVDKESEFDLSWQITLGSKPVICSMTENDSSISVSAGTVVCLPENIPGIIKALNGNPNLFTPQSS